MRCTGGASDHAPAWSPDGSSRAFIRFGTGSLGEPSPDGRLIAFVSRHETYGGEGGDQVYTVRADGTGLVRRTAIELQRGAWP